MSRRLALSLMPLALVAATSPAAASARRPPAQSKRQAEVKVLGAVAAKWSAKQLPGLVNPRTHLLADNTEAVCHGQRRKYAGNRYGRFICVVRPHIHSRRQGLYVSYRVLPRGRFVMRWIVYHRH